MVRQNVCSENNVKIQWRVYDLSEKRALILFFELSSFHEGYGGDSSPGYALLNFEYLWTLPHFQKVERRRSSN